MFLREIISNPTNESIMSTQIKTHCSEYLQETKKPLYKLLPSTYNNFCKVKVRQKKSVNEVGGVMNKAFEDKFYNLHQRAVFAETIKPTKNIQKNVEPFFIFPVDNYKYLISKTSQVLTEDYGSLLKTLLSEFENTENAFDILVSLIKNNYETTGLNEGIGSNREVILYNIPFYYAAKTSFIPDYRKFIKYASY